MIISIVLIFSVYFFLANRKQRTIGKLIERTVNLICAEFDDSLPADVSRRRVSDTRISTTEVLTYFCSQARFLILKFEVEFLGTMST